MRTVTLTDGQWQKILPFLRTCSNIYIGQEEDAAVSLMPFCGLLVAVLNGVSCPMNMAIGTAFKNASHDGLRKASLKSSLNFSLLTVTSNT